MSWQPPGSGTSAAQYSPDGRWYWDGERWHPVPQQTPPATAPTGQVGGIGTSSWAPRPPSPSPSPAPPSVQPPPAWQAQPVPPAAAPVVAPPGMFRARRRRSYLVDLSIVLVALLVLGGIGTGTVLAIRNHQTSVPSSAPSAAAIFEMPFTKDVRSARFHEVEKTGGSKITGAGVIDFAPQHAFSEVLSGVGGIFERDVQTGEVAYEQIAGEKYQATDSEDVHFQLMGWDGSAPPQDLEIARQTKLDGQQAWVLKQAHGSNEWIVGEQTGDPLEMVVDKMDSYTFSDWSHAPAIQAPPAAQVSTTIYRGSGDSPVAAPAAKVTVLKEKVDPTPGQDDPPGFQTIALEISYENTTKSPSDFDNLLSLVSSQGVFAISGFTQLTPSFKPGAGVSPGQTVTGWDAFTVPTDSTSFHLLFAEQADQSQSLDYLISIAVTVPR